jgi:outer membrane protein assembly factor BamB
MPGLRIAFLSLACLLTAASPGLAQSSSIGTTLPSEPVLNHYGLTRAWWGQATMNPARDKVEHLVSDEELTFVQATSGIVTAFDNQTGKHLWAVQLDRTDQPSYPLVTNDDFALIAAGMTLYALDKWTGDVAWKHRLASFPSTSPTTDETQIYLGALDGSLYAYDLHKIQELYSERRLPEWSYQTLSWRHQASQEVTTPAISAEGLVSFASRGRTLYSIRYSAKTNRRELNFQFETNAPVSAPLAFVNGFLYLASEDDYVYCINNQTGQVKWRRAMALPVRKAPHIIDDQMFVTPARGGMHCWSASTGKPQWWRGRTSEFLAATPSLIFASDDLGNLVILERKTGTTLAALPWGRFSVRVANDRTDRLFMATESGLVVCIHERDREFPLYHKHADRKPILPQFATEED